MKIESLNIKVLNDGSLLVTYCTYGEENQRYTYQCSFRTWAEFVGWVLQKVTEGFV